MYQYPRLRVLVGCALLLVGIAFCNYLVTSSIAAEESTAGSDAPNQEYSKQLLKIAAEYRQWGRVDDEMRWAPELCRTPQVATARFSKSDDSNGHGQKLYSLFALDRKAYLSLWCDPNQLGLITREQKPIFSKLGIKQALVKESWKPALADNVQYDQAGRLPFNTQSNNPNETASLTETDHFSPYAERDGKIYRADKKTALFIMMQLKTKTADSDDGWIYGTVSADGKQVTSVGLVKSCMECHQQATHGRLFGIDYHGQ